MSDLEELLQLARTTKPRMRRKGPPFTKRFLKWNRHMLYSGKATYYANTAKLYNPEKGRYGSFVKKRWDRRTKGKNRRLIKAQRSLFGSVLTPEDPNMVHENLPPSQYTNNWHLIEELVGDRTGRQRIIIKQDGAILHDDIHLIGEDDLSFMIHPSPQEPVWIKATNHDLNLTVIITKLLKLPAQYYQQAFASGPVHCFFGQVVKWAKAEIGRKNECNILPRLFGEPLSQTKKEKSIISKILGIQFKKHRRKGYIDDYPANKGVKESDLQAVCDDLSIGIKIFQPYAPKITIDLRCPERPLKIFRFLNGEYNHLSVPKWFPSASCGNQTVQFNINSMFMDDAKGIERSRKELEEMTTQKVSWFPKVWYNKDEFGVCRVKTNDAVYHLPDKFIEIKNAFEKEYNFQHYKIEEAKNPDVAQFINEGTHWNGTRDFVDELPAANHPNLTHIDQKAAYTGFKDSRYYCGFVGNFGNFRVINPDFDWKNHNGLYEITDINFDKCSSKFKTAMEHLGWFHNDIPYWKSELLLLEKHGATFNITKGMIGLTFHFDFPESMFEKQKVRLGKKVFDIPFYAKWVGMCASTGTSRKVYTNGQDKKYMQTLQAAFQKENTKNGTVIYHYADSDEYLLETPKKRKTLQHIAGQITAYQRLCMFEQLMEMNIDKVVRVCVDGIYFWKHDVELINGFRYKTENMHFINTQCEDYLSGVFCNARPPVLSTGGPGAPMKFIKKTLKEGAGGTGKTHSVLNDKGFVKILYVAPSHKLSADMTSLKRFPDRDATVMARLLSPALKYKHLKQYPVYCIDEASMIIEADKWKIFDINPNAQFIFCGDIGYQLPPIVDEDMRKKYENPCDLEEMNSTGFDKIETCTDNYRNGNKSDEKNWEKLTKILNNLRLAIKSAPEWVLEKYFKNFDYSRFQVLERVEESISEFRGQATFGYEITDLIICAEGGKNNKNPKAACNVYTEKFKHLKKYRILENKNGVFNGEIVFTKPKGVRSELRHGYTIHSIQGETAENKLFIIMSKMKSLRMFYTALSRARRWDQIYLVKGV